MFLKISTLHQFVSLLCRLDFSLERISFFRFEVQAFKKNEGARLAPSTFAHAPITSSIPIYPLSPPRQITVQ
jgi:hypothetical protein